MKTMVVWRHTDRERRRKVKEETCGVVVIVVGGGGMGATGMYVMTVLGYPLQGGVMNGQGNASEINMNA